MGQRRRRSSPVLRHHAERDHPAIAAAARHIEVVVAHGADLSREGKGTVIRRLSHGRTNPELTLDVESSWTAHHTGFWVRVATEPKLSSPGRCSMLFQVS